MKHSADMSSPKSAIPSETGDNPLKKNVYALVVDDDPISRRIHKALLTKFELETHVAENGKEAVELYNSGLQFDLILMDMQMPLMDGIQATRELRGMGVNCKIVGVTAFDFEPEKQTFIRAGLDHFLEKPLNEGKIRSLLEGFEMTGTD